MNRVAISQKTSLIANVSYIGESIERKIERFMETNERLDEDNVPIIHMAREEGINPNYNIRSDRFELALDALDIVHKSEVAKREERLKLKTDNPEEGEIDATS